MTGYRVVHCAARKTAVLRASVAVADLPTFLQGALRRVLASMEDQGALPAGEAFAYYHGVPDGVVAVESGFPVLNHFRPAGDVMPSELPSGLVVVGVHAGPHSLLAATYADMCAWAKVHGLTPTGDMWEVHLTDPEREADPRRWRAEVYLRVH